MSPAAGLLPGARGRLERVFRAALAAVEPEALVRAAWPSLADANGLRVVAAGKGAAPMARGLLAKAGEQVKDLLVVTKDGHGLDLVVHPDDTTASASTRHGVARAALDLREAGHPLPDARSAGAGRAARELAGRCCAGESLLVLLSGGASALLTEPQPGLSREDLLETTRVMLEAGADIAVLNAVRKHLTRVSGGRLARAAAGADRVWVLALSDVPGDDPATLASGPCTPDPTTFGDAREGAQTCGAWPRLPAAVRVHLERGEQGEIDESPKPDERGWGRVEVRLLGSNRTALDAAEAEAGRLGLRVDRDPVGLTGEAREAGRRLALHGPRPSEGPRLVLSGGETTVHVRGRGRGGRSQELALGAAIAWDETSPRRPAALLAAGTDGTDGPTDAAGAFADPATVARGRAAGQEAREALADNDAYTFFRAEGGLFVTGPTRTNVMDLALVEWGEADR